jgi:hypothetical protein
MDDPLIFGYQLCGAITVYMTQEVEKGGVLDVPVLPGGTPGGDSSRYRGGSPIKPH